MTLASPVGLRLLPRPVSTPFLSLLTFNRLRSLQVARQPWQHTLPFTTAITLLAKPLPPRRQIPDSELEESFLKGSGPGGQKINKTNSAVQLKHLPTGLVVKCQETRSRAQNRKLARRILGERLEEMELGDMARTRIKGRGVARKKASKRKKSLRKYRRLEEEKRMGKEGDGDGNREDGWVEEEGEVGNDKDIRENGKDGPGKTA